jgi:hypothetical protein
MVTITTYTRRSVVEVKPDHLLSVQVDEIRAEEYRQIADTFPAQPASTNPKQASGRVLAPPTGAY